MNASAPDTLRLKQLLRLAAKEAQHLQAVRQRLFGATDRMEVSQLTALLQNPDGIDRLESFGAKFSRMQDTLIDKLLPSLLRSAGEHPGNAIDTSIVLKGWGCYPAPPNGSPCVACAAAWCMNT